MSLPIDQITNAIVVIIVGVVVGVSNRMGRIKAARDVEQHLIAHNELTEQDRLERKQTLFEIQSDQVALKTQQNVIHTLVNSSVLELKRQFMIAADTLARITGTEENKRIAQAAARAYSEQVARQEAVDNAVALGKQRALLELTEQSMANPLGKQHSPMGPEYSPKSAPLTSVSS